jgi:hypothetical protein
MKNFCQAESADVGRNILSRFSFFDCHRAKTVLRDKKNLCASVQSMVGK